jgi:2-polyprenyl-3-methyl-5-hydroxy-6-metoxy-1,4-benzoquinol methylase
MAIIQVVTQDPNFGFIIHKNPASGMQLRSIRQGTSFGWYSKNNTVYNILFKDADNAVSFGDQEFEYLNTSRYNSPVFVLNAISEYFNSTVKSQSEIDVDGFEKSFLINAIDLKSLFQLSQFEKYFPDFEIEYDLYTAKSFKLKISTKKSFHMLFNYVNLLMLFIVLTKDDEFLQLNDDSIEKYLSSIERLNAPFFIRYLFSRNMLRNKNQFEKYKPRLENTTLYESTKMQYGDTATQRFRAIKQLVSFDKPILDIGCGEGFYAIPFSMLLNDEINYYAIDIDEKLIQTVRKKADKKNIINLKVYNHIDLFLKNYDGDVVDIILTEVIEHMPIYESKELIKKIINTVNFNKLIITVPNKEFNEFYMIGDDEFRHYDHKWEPTYDEFKNLVLTEIDSQFKTDFIKIGDTVNDISTSIGCLITKSV